MSIFKIFYAFSNDGVWQRELYESMSKKLEEQSVEIIDVEKQFGAFKLDDNIFQQINECDLFIADITPEKKDDNNKPIFNPNVMIELGYALANKDES